MNMHRYFLHNTLQLLALIVVVEIVVGVAMVIINVYKRFYLFFYKKTRFLMFFLFFQSFLFKKTLNCLCENNANLKHLCTKTEKSNCCR